MATRMVICVDCGRRFDAEKEGAKYIPSSRRYQCMDCAKKEETAMKQRRIENAGRADFSGVKKQKPWALILKLFFGVLSIVSCIGADMEAGARILGIVVGLALIAWALYPFCMAKRALDQAKKRQQEEIARQAAEEEAIRNAPWTCPACGGKTKGDACEYCGTPKQ